MCKNSTYKRFHWYAAHSIVANMLDNYLYKIISISLMLWRCDVTSQKVWNLVSETSDISGRLSELFQTNVFSLKESQNPFGEAWS